VSTRYGHYRHDRYFTPTGDDVARSKNAPLIGAVIAGVVLIGILKVTVGSGGGNKKHADASATAGPPRQGCETVSIAASSEKAALMGTIAASYNGSNRTVGGKCYSVKVNSVASGGAEKRLADGWDEAAYGPGPDAWTPAASTWLRLLTSDATAKDKPNILPTESPSIASTPLILAMPEPMAQALGWPKASLGWSDVLSLANDSKGWAAKGHPEWGNFLLGKTNPNLSTSGLAATVGAFVAATGRSSDLTVADLTDPKVRTFVTGVEHAVVHYGDTTLTYLANLQRADDAGAAMGYVSAVAVEEKSVLDYNGGNPSGDPATVGKHPKPKVPLVAIYPKEGTLNSDSPYAILNAPWSTDARKAGAKDFLDYLRQPAQQKVFTDAGFRTFDNEPGQPITDSKSVLADGVKITLSPPNPQVLSGVRSTWEQLRKPARILLLLDTSGSMGDEAGQSGKTKLELAKSAAATALKQLAPRDMVGVWKFTTGLKTPDKIHEELVPIAALSQNRQQVTTSIQNLIPQAGTPLYGAIRAASDDLKNHADSDAINAVVVLTDGRNEYPPDNDLSGLVRTLSDQAKEGGVRVFSIAYGQDADLNVLKSISEASRAAAYDATNPTTIDTVFTNVLSNF
jgi:Ca-activated chloride channel homolog